MSFGLTDEKLLAFYCLQTFTNSFPFINPNDIKTLRLDASGYDKPNKKKFIKFQSLVPEIMQFLKIIQKIQKIIIFFRLELINKHFLNNI